MPKPKSKSQKIILYLITIVLLWIVVTNFIQAIKCTKMTQIQLFLHLPKSFMLNFESCENYNKN